MQFGIIITSKLQKITPLSLKNVISGSSKNSTTALQSNRYENETKKQLSGYEPSGSEQPFLFVNFPVFPNEIFFFLTAKF